MSILYFNRHEEPDVLKQKFTNEYSKLLHELERLGSSCKLSANQIGVIKQQVFNSWGVVQERLNQGEEIENLLQELPDFYESFVKKIESPMVERFELAMKISEKEISKGFSMIIAGGTEVVLIEHLFKEIKNAGNKVKKPCCEEEETEEMFNEREDGFEEDIQSVMIQWEKYQGSDYISSVGITVKGSDPNQFHELAPFSYLGTKAQIKLNPHRVIRILDMIGLSVGVDFLGPTHFPRSVKVMARIVGYACKNETGALFKKIMELTPENFNAANVGWPELSTVRRMASDIRNVYRTNMPDHLHLRFLSRRMIWWQDGGEERNISHSLPPFDFAGMLKIWEKAGFKVVGNDAAQRVTLIIPAPMRSEYPPCAPTLIEATEQNDGDASALVAQTPKP